MNKQYRPYSEKILEIGLTEVKGVYTLNYCCSGIK